MKVFNKLAKPKNRRFYTRRIKIKKTKSVNYRKMPNLLHKLTEREDKP